MRKKGAKVAEKTEAQKAEDFKRLAAKRVNAIARQCAGLGKMGGSSKYAYTPAEVKALATYVQEQVEAAFDRLNGKKAVAAGFSFD